MLLKYSQYQKRSKLGACGKPQRGSVTGSKKIAASKGHRKGKGVGSKRVSGSRTIVGRREEVRVDPCDNSNDSGLGFDQADYSSHHSFTYSQWGEDVGGPIKRARIVDIKLESDDANDNFTFPQVDTVVPPPRPSVAKVERRTEVGGKVGRSVGKRSVVGASCPSVAKSRDGSIQLEIVSQPETQHRARYQTEGSRGAVKDTTGNSFPLVKLSGYEGNETAVLQVYIGTDQGKVAPHMFYQACKVSGKNSTPCIEKKVNGTVVIEIEFNPSKDMLVLCDCVGILKERNVDVEHRFPEESTAKSRKKSTRCRMVFRTTVLLKDGTSETIQVTSHPIVCTQPPGVPEICKKSLSSCPVSGGIDLFIIGKNFLKDTRVRFSQGEPTMDNYWELLVQPDKEYLHQSHLVCSVPRYRCEELKEPMSVSVSIVSGGKSSEPVPFIYTPLGTFPSQQLNSAPYFAIPRDLSSESQTLVARIPEVTSYSSPHFPANIEMPSSSMVNGCLSTENKGVKEEGWREDVNLGLLGGSNGTNLASSLQALNAAGIVQTSSISPAMVSSLMHSSGLGSAPTLDQQPIAQPQTMSLSPSMQPPSLAHSPNIVQVNMSQSPNLGQTQGMALSPNMVQRVSLMNSPPLIQTASITHPTNMTGITHSPNMLQSPNQSQSSNLIQSPALQASSVVDPNSPVQSPNLVNSSILHTSTLGETTSIMQSSTIVDTNIIQPTNLVDSGTNLISNSNLTETSNMIQTTNIVDSSNILQTSTIGDSSNMIQAASIGNTPNLMSSPNTNLLTTSNIVDAPTIMQTQNIGETSNLVDSSIIQNSTIVEPSNIIETSSIVENANIMQASSMVESNIIQTSSIVENTVLQAPSMVENPNIMQASNMVEAPNMIQSTSIVESSNLLQNSNIVATDSVMRSSNMIGGSSVSAGLVEGRNGALVVGLMELKEAQNELGTSMATIDKFVRARPLESRNELGPSMATIEKFVTARPLPALSVETYLSHLEKPKQVYQPSLLTTIPSEQPSGPLALKQMLDNCTTGFSTGKNLENLRQGNVMLENSYSSQGYLSSSEFSNHFAYQQANSVPAAQSSANKSDSTNPVNQQQEPSVHSSAAKCHEHHSSIPLPHELTAMSENDLISYINPSCFDQV